MFDALSCSPDLQNSEICKMAQNGAPDLPGENGLKSLDKNMSCQVGVICEVPGAKMKVLLSCVLLSNRLIFF